VRLPSIPGSYCWDDFTARVDASTEEKILANVQKNYPGITLLSVTQKIAPIESYDQIILLMEGGNDRHGRHEELMMDLPGIRTNL